MLNLDIVLTVVLFIVFIGIIAWAWSPGRKRDFNDAAHLIIDDDIDSVKSKPDSEEHKHG